MAKKKAVVDYMKFVPIGVMAVSLIAGYVTLQNRVANAEEKLSSQREWLVKQSQDTSSIQVSQARMEEKVNGIYEAIRDLKK